MSLLVVHVGPVERSYRFSFFFCCDTFSGSLTAVQYTIEQLLEWSWCFIFCRLLNISCELIWKFLNLLRFWLAEFLITTKIQLHQIQHTCLMCYSFISFIAESPRPAHNLQTCLEASFIHPLIGSSNGMYNDCASLGSLRPMSKDNWAIRYWIFTLPGHLRLTHKHTHNHQLEAPHKDIPREIERLSSSKVQTMCNSFKSTVPSECYKTKECKLLLVRVTFSSTITAPSRQAATNHPISCQANAPLQTQQLLKSASCWHKRLHKAAREQMHGEQTKRCTKYCWVRWCIYRCFYPSLLGWL